MSVYALDKGGDVFKLHLKNVFLMPSGGPNLLSIPRLGAAGHHHNDTDKVLRFHCGDGVGVPLDQGRNGSWHLRASLLSTGDRTPVLPLRIQSPIGQLVQDAGLAT